MSCNTISRPVLFQLPDIGLFQLPAFRLRQYSLCPDKSLHILPDFYAVSAGNCLEEVAFEFHHFKPPVIVKVLHEVGKHYLAGENGMVVSDVVSLEHDAVLQFYLKPCAELLNVNLHPLRV